MEDANVQRVRVVVAAGEASCEQVRHVLRRFDWAVEEMPDPEAALRRCQADAPDLLLLDAGLIREGADVPLFEELRQDAGLNDMRILVMAADMEVEQALAGLDLGVDEYLLEPVQQADVAVRLRTAQRLWQLERQILELQADLERIAHTDALTGMYNRRFLAQQLVAQINSARRHGRIQPPAHAAGHVECGGQRERHDHVGARGNRLHRRRRHHQRNVQRGVRCGRNG